MLGFQRIVGSLSDLINQVLERRFRRKDEEVNWYRRSKKLLTKVHNRGLDLTLYSVQVELRDDDLEIKKLGEELSEHAAEAPTSISGQLVNEVRSMGNICIELSNAFSKHKDDSVREFIRILLFQEERRKIGSDSEIDEEDIKELLQRYGFAEQIEAQIGAGELSFDMREEQLREFAVSHGIDQAELDFSDKEIASLAAMIRNEGVENTTEVFQLISDELLTVEDEEVSNEQQLSEDEIEEIFGNEPDESSDVLGVALQPVVNTLLVGLTQQLIDRIDEEYS